MNRNSLLALCLTLLAAIATTACGPNRADNMAAQHLAEQEGWIVAQTQVVDGNGYDIQIIRSRVETETVGYTKKNMLIVQVCYFKSDGAGPKDKGCETVIKKEVTDPASKPTDQQ